MRRHDEKQAAFVLDLRQVGQGDLERAGGKGANLGELIRAGLPVPAGFVVDTAAYDRFVAHNRLEQTIAPSLRDSEGGGAEIRAAFEAAPIPPEVEREVLAAYGQLGEGAVAVRSSATAEDLPEAAFAGQQDTFLNVIGAEALLDAVRRCWASLWNDRAIAYRTRLGLDQRTVKLAVVVQRMVPAEAAGVMFTANPVTGARDEIVVDASPGLGEAVVSGLVTPDHFVLRRRWLGRWGWRMAERRQGQREWIVRARAGGGTEHTTGQGPAVPTLPDPALRPLARMGRTIERHFGCPQDVEWAWTGRTLLIVQARPITALPEPAPRLTKLARVLAAMGAEMIAIRPYPLDVTVWEPALFDAIAPLFAFVGFAIDPIDRIFVQEDGVVLRLSGRLPFRPTPAILLAPLRLLWVASRYESTRWEADPLLAETRSRARSLESLEVRTLSWGELLATLREARTLPRAIAGELRTRYMPRAALAFGLLHLILRLLGQADLSKALLSGVTNKTLEANQALEALAAQIRSKPTLADLFAHQEPATLWPALDAQPAGKAFLADLGDFLDRYGHREEVIFTASRPTWKEAPEVVLGLLKGLAHSESRPRAGRPAWEVARDAVLAHPLLRLSQLRSAFLKLLAEARCLMQIREDTHFYATLALPVIRRMVLELGRRLSDVGVLDAPDDVFHLTLGELERLEGPWPPPRELADQLRRVALRRKGKRAELEGVPVVDPRWFSRAEVNGDVLLSGTPGSPGVVEGAVCVVRDASEFGKLQAGKVLVAPFTNPAWTPLFERAAAVVVDTGSPGSHAAIVAREYGIPAVMATVEGTRRLADGQWIRVDGTAGVVLDVQQSAGDADA